MAAELILKIKMNDFTFSIKVKFIDHLSKYYLKKKERSEQT